MSDLVETPEKRFSHGAAHVGLDRSVLQRFTSIGHYYEGH